MNPQQHRNASLALKPVDAQANCEQAAIIELCRHNGLAGEAIAGKSGHYLAGERFLDWISFLGCSPEIHFQQQDDRHFTYLVFHHHEHPMLYHGAYSRPPHCPYCNKSMQDWRDRQAQTQWHCRHCGQQSSAFDWHWRKTAGFARCLIEITDIYPREALPQTLLLQQLADLTAEKWDYFYF